MRAAANFFAELAHGVHFYFFAVLAFKQADCAFRLGVRHGGFHAGNRRGGGNGFVYQLFHLGNLFRGHLAAEGKIKPQALGGNVAALLRHFRPQHLTERRVQQVGSGMQARGLLAVVGQTALKNLLRARVAVFLMLLKAGIVAFHIHGQAAFFGQFQRHFHGEAVSVVQVEGAFAVDHAVFHLLGDLFKLAVALLEGLGEAGFLQRKLLQHEGGVAL